MDIRVKIRIIAKEGEELSMHLQVLLHFLWNFPRKEVTWLLILIKHLNFFSFFLPSVKGEMNQPS